MHIEKPKCKFYRQGDNNSCKNGDNCKFSHDVIRNSPSQEDNFIRNQKAHLIEGPKAQSNKVENREYPQKIQRTEQRGNRQSPIYRSKEMQEQGDREGRTKSIYISNLIDSLRKQCLKCSKLDHLVITSCGCQKICKGCWAKTEKCPQCNSSISRQLCIDAFN